MKRIILASTSPRRQELLKAAGFEFEIRPPEVNENIIGTKSFSDLAEALAKRKAEVVRNTEGDDAVIIGADTIVVLDNEVMGKPTSSEEAIGMLKRLSGRTHDVITGVCVLSDSQVNTFSESTAVTFKQLSDEEIAHYVEVYKPFDKAGAYGIQEWIGLVGITRIEGDYFNVVGLPVARLVPVLRDVLGL